MLRHDWQFNLQLADHLARGLGSPMAAAALPAGGRPEAARQAGLEVNGAFSVGPSKSAAGRRTVALPAVVVEALAERLAA